MLQRKENIIFSGHQKFPEIFGNFWKFMEISGNIKSFRKFYNPKSAHKNIDDIDAASK